MNQNRRCGFRISCSKKEMSGKRGVIKMRCYQKGKKIFIVSIFLLMLILLLDNRAAFADTSGTCGDDLTWTLDDEGLLTISGQGDMTDYSYWPDTHPWDSGSVRNVILENGVTSIGGAAFRSCSNLESVFLSDTVTTINRYAFYQCNSLRKINIPASVTTINAWDVFYQCDSLVTAGPIGSGCSIEFGWAEAIPANAFRALGKLNSVTLPDTIHTVGNSAFSGCSSLAAVNTPHDLSYIGDYAFQGCPVLSFTIPSGVTYIGAYAFSGSGIQSVDIPNGTEIIREYSFNNCVNLNHLSIPESVTTIEQNAFFGCSSLLSAGPARSGCDYEFGWDSFIPDFAFSGCSGLISIAFPETITEIPNHCCNNCSEIVSIAIPESVTEIGEDAFRNCTKLETVLFPRNLKSIGNYAFKSCPALLELHLPDNLLSIGDGAFAFDTSLSEVVFPASLKRIGRLAFDSCSGLSHVVVPASVDTLGSGAFIFCNQITNAGPIGTDSAYEFGWTESIPDYAFSSSRLSEIIFPEGVKNIGNYTFHNCGRLTEIVIPETVESIGEGAFMYCSELTGFIFPDRVTSIEESVLEHCANLLSVHIPENAESIGSDAFAYCTNLEHLRIPPNIKTTGRAIVAECTKLTTAGPYGSGADMEFGWTDSIPDYVFYWCSSLSSITIPENVTILGDYAFGHCGALSNVTIPDSVTTIGVGAFAECTSLTDVYYGGTQEQWQLIEIGNNNAPLASAMIHITALPDFVLPSDLTAIEEAVFSGCAFIYVTLS